MKRLLVGFFTTLGLFGCGSTLELSLYTPQTNQLPKGVIFHLPKTELSITFTHTIYETKIFKINDQGKLALTPLNTIPSLKILLPSMRL